MTLTVSASLVFTATSLGDTFTIKAAGSLGSFHWDPDVRRIAKNDRIKFKNPSSQSVQHNVKAYGGNWTYDRTLSSGEAVFRKFRRTGLFRFRCRFHSDRKNGEWVGMLGKVRVRNPG
jgi:plastocyanin